MSGDFMQGNKDDAVAVPFSDDKEAPANDVADLDEDSPNATPEERVTRKQRRQARIQTMLQEGKQSKEELAALRAEQAKTREELAVLRGHLAAQTQQRPANDDGKDPYQRRLDAVYEEQQAAYTACQAEADAGTLTPERRKYYEGVARKVETDKIRILSEQTADTRAVNTRAEQAQQIWVQKYPEIYNNPRAYQYAKATWERRQAMGEAVSHDMVDEVMHETMTTFKLGKRAAPTASDRARMTGLPSSGGGGSTRSAGIVMTPALTRMAEAAYPDLPQSEAVKKWVDKTGKKLREKKVV